MLLVSKINQRTLNLLQYQDRLKSPLRYPGGKQRVIKYLKEFFPKNFDEYREPFLGGGSAFFEVFFDQKCRNFWINDLNPEVFYFWQQVQHNLDSLVDLVRDTKMNCSDGRSLFNSYIYSDDKKHHIDVEKLTPLERAARFFVLNRITFSGTIECGGYSQNAFDKRFTDSSVDRLAKTSINPAVKITCLDYSSLLEFTPNQNVFIFLDPPYFQNKSNRLYGRKGGLLHLLFSHELLAENLKQCKYKWLMTCDDCEPIRDIFGFANLKPFEVQYSLNNVNRSLIGKAQELLISNYDFTNI